ncbi:hypothetical protein VTG60DRAFT_4730 [Thermothelomyces hinnuleus]
MVAERQFTLARPAAVERGTSPTWGHFPRLRTLALTVHLRRVHRSPVKTSGTRCREMQAEHAELAGSTLAQPKIEVADPERRSSIPASSTCFPILGSTLRIAFRTASVEGPL